MERSYHNKLCLGCFNNPVVLEYQVPINNLKEDWPIGYFLQAENSVCLIKI